MTGPTPDHYARRRALRRALAGGLSFALGAALNRQAVAQWRPGKPIRIIIGSTPGGLPDRLARLLSEHFATDLGQAAIVENRPGASGKLAADIVLNAPADGLTLTICFLGPAGLLPAFATPPTDATGAEGFEPVGIIGYGSAVVVTSARNPWQDLREFAAYARANPQAPLSFASAGAATIVRLYGEVIAAKVQRPMMHVAYKGMMPALTDVAAGEISFLVATPPAALPLISSGRLRPLAVTSGFRAPELAQVRTLAEQGFGEVDRPAWYGVYAAAATPPAVVSALNESIGRFITSPRVVAELNQIGLDVAAPMPPAKISALLKDDMSVWKKAVTQLGLKLE
ncbi:MAG: tripartite tricarboxylate transporter substrate binding protein [Burkholderiales bacterium]|nr:tripartite tricarboxylate transporter substrate binding protein [Burkholderiales bacterium]